MNFGAFPQRLLWASTGTKDPNASDVLYVKNLIAPYTINTLPEATLLAWADHGEAGPVLTDSPAETKAMLQKYASASVDVTKLGLQLQNEGADAFNKSWDHLISAIETKQQKF
jgi:transaldolase